MKAAILAATTCCFFSSLKTLPIPAAAWHARFASEVVGAQEILAIALDRELPTEVIGDKSMLSRAQRLGRALHAIGDRKFGQLRVELATRAHNVSRWRVVVLPPADGAR